jgi:hypothetical protein
MHMQRSCKLLDRDTYFNNFVDRFINNLNNKFDKNVLESHA